MTKAGKRLERLLAVPPPKDFTWEEAVTVLEHAGFVASCPGGSHYLFHHSRMGFTFRTSKPHKRRGSEFLKHYQIRDLVRALEKVGATPNADDEISGVQRLN